jgi:poly-gamma-glutamate synthesis protein (capsule biosynthesis protein)
MEMYKGVPIFYSLGNFLYQTNGLDFRAADQFDAGNNLYTSALGAAGAASSPFGQLDRDWWWKSVLIVATAEGGRLSDLKAYAISLRPPGGQPGQKGLPQLATGVEGDTILRQFSALSKRLGTDVGDAVSSGVLTVPISGNR